MGDPTVIASVLGLVSIAISAYAGVATKRSADKASVRNTNTSSRTDIEKEAFKRAEEFYLNRAKSADEEIARQGREIVACHKTEDDLEAEISALKKRVKTLEDELETARRALKLRYPDE